MEIYTQEDVDNWTEENDTNCADSLLDEMLPKHRAKLASLDKRIMKVLAEIKEVFPDAQYYTASGGFTLVLGCTHDDIGAAAQQHRSAWGGFAQIGDGDW